MDHTASSVRIPDWCSRHAFGRVVLFDSFPCTDASPTQKTDQVREEKLQKTGDQKTADDVTQRVGEAVSKLVFTDDPAYKGTAFSISAGVRCVGVPPPT